MNTNLKELLNDEQKAFEEFIHRAINLPKDGMIDTGELFKLIDKHNSFLALHDQKIITAVIGMVDEVLEKMWQDQNYMHNSVNDAKKDAYYQSSFILDVARKKIKSDLQQALKKV